MKVKLIIFSIVAIMFALPSQAQKKGFSNIVSNSITVGKLNGESFSSLDFRMTAGYRLTGNFALRMPLELSVGRFGIGDDRAYAENIFLGAEAGYAFLSNSYRYLEVAASGGSTIVSTTDWQYAYCDCGLKYALGGKGQITRMFYEIGVRYYLPHGNVYSNFLTGRITLGFVLN